MKFKKTLLYVSLILFLAFLQKVIFRVFALQSDSWIMNWISFALFFAIISLFIENINREKQNSN